MDIDYLCMRNSKIKKKVFLTSKAIRKISIDIQRIIKVIVIYVMWTGIPKEFYFTFKNRENIIRNQNNNSSKWRQSQQQEKKSLNYLKNSGNYNNYNNKTPLKYTRSEVHSDNTSNYDEDFDFIDARVLIYRKKQNNKNMVGNTNS